MTAGAANADRDDDQRQGKHREGRGPRTQRTEKTSCSSWSCSPSVVGASLRSCGCCSQHEDNGVILRRPRDEAGSICATIPPPSLTRCAGTWRRPARSVSGPQRTGRVDLTGRHGLTSRHGAIARGSIDDPVEQADSAMESLAGGPRDRTSRGHVDRFRPGTFVAFAVPGSIPFNGRISDVNSLLKEFFHIQEKTITDPSGGGPGLNDIGDSRQKSTATRLTTPPDFVSLC